jgi:hypothetical protein
VTERGAEASASDDGSIDCPHCRQAVPLPHVGDWIVPDEYQLTPTMTSFPCPHCKERIDLNEE